MRNLINTLTVVVVLAAVSCKKYLNVVPDDVATLSSSFANSNETEAYLVGNCYSRDRKSVV